MGCLTHFWKKVTATNAVAYSSGVYEMMFFESIYRIIYAAGLSTTESSVSYLVYSSTVKLMIAAIMFGEVNYAYSESRTLEMDKIATSVNVIVIQIFTIYKVKNMMDHRDIYRRLVNSMESVYFDTSTAERRRLVKFWADRHERYLMLLLGLGFVAQVAWCLYPLLDDVDYNLMVEIHLPFYFNTPYRYSFTYLIVGIAFTYVAFFVMIIDLLMQAYLVPLACQMSVLADCFLNIIEDCKKGITENTIELEKNTEFKKRYLQRLGELIEQHKSILSNTLDLRAILTGPLLGQLVASGTLICFVAYQVTTVIVENFVKCLMSVFYLGYNLFSFYIICMRCEEITTQDHFETSIYRLFGILTYYALLRGIHKKIPNRPLSVIPVLSVTRKVLGFKGAKIGEAAYCSGWEHGLATLPGVRASIALVIARASKPLVFTAGGMYELSLNTFTKLVKTSYSALTVLLRFRHE